MKFNHYSENAVEQFRFFKLPKGLFENEDFRELSIEAKVLYSILRDRMEYSVIHNQVDENGVYIIFTIENIKTCLQCANTKACQLLKELEDFGLVLKKKKGRGNPSHLYVMDFTSPVKEVEDVPEVKEDPGKDNNNQESSNNCDNQNECNMTASQEFRKSEFLNQEFSKPEFLKSECNDTNINYNETNRDNFYLNNNNTYSIYKTNKHNLKNSYSKESDKNNETRNVVVEKNQDVIKHFDSLVTDYKKSLVNVFANDPKSIKEVKDTYDQLNKILKVLPKDAADIVRKMDQDQAGDLFHKAWETLYPDEYHTKVCQPVRNASGYLIGYIRNQAA